MQRIAASLGSARLLALCANLRSIKVDCMRSNRLLEDTPKSVWIFVVKTYAICTPSFEPLREIFEKTAPADLDLNVIHLDAPPEKGFQSEVLVRVPHPKGPTLHGLDRESSGRNHCACSTSTFSSLPLANRPSWLVSPITILRSKLRPPPDNPEHTDFNSGVVVVRCNERTLALYKHACESDLAA